MRRRDIMSTYCTVSRSDKFEFLYEYYYNYKNILSCERSCVIYMIESFMMKYHWDEYAKDILIELRESTGMNRHQFCEYFEKENLING